MKKLLAVVLLCALGAAAAVGTAVARDGADDRAAVVTSPQQRDDDGSRHGHGGHHGPGGDDGEDRRETGEDLRGNCDEAEHALDANCRGVARTVASRATTAARRTSVAAGRRLMGVVGPGFTLTLRTPSGARVTTVKAGTYTVIVRDRSSEHNFRLRGKGINKATRVGAVTSATWRVKLVRGTYTYVCDPHAPMMRGTLRVR